MKRVSLAFLDMLFCMLLAFFLLINPDASADHPPPADYTITMGWPDGDVDVDVFVETPRGEFVWYGNKDIGTVSIDRDDLGKRADPSLWNQEIVAFRTPEPGCYHTSIHTYRDPDELAGRMMELELRNTAGKRLKYRRLPIPPWRVEEPVWRLCVDNGDMTVRDGDRAIRARARQSKRKRGPT